MDSSEACEVDLSMWDFPDVLACPDYKQTVIRLASPDLDPDKLVHVVPVSPDVHLTKRYTMYSCDQEKLQEAGLSSNTQNRIYIRDMKTLYIKDLRYTREAFHPHVDFNPIPVLLNHLHGNCGELTSMTEAISVFLLIHYLPVGTSLPKMKTYYADRILDFLHAGNCLETMREFDEFFFEEFGHKYCHKNKLTDMGSNVRRIYKGCFNLCLRNFKSLAAGKDFGQLDYYFVEHLVRHNMLNVDNEDQTKAAIKLWMRNSEARRHDCEAEGRVPVWRKVEEEELIRVGVREDENSEVKGILRLCGIDTHTETRNKWPRLKPDTLITLGGERMINGIRTGLNQVLFYDHVGGKLERLSHVPSNNGRALIGFSTCVVDDEIWVSGGCYNFSDHWNRELFIYNSLTDHWRRRDFGEPRRHHGSCSDGEYLFLAGGFGKYRQRMTTILTHRLKGGVVTRSSKNSVCDVPNLPVTVLKPSVFCHNNILHVLCEQELYQCNLKANKQWSKIRPSVLGPRDVMVTCDVVKLNQDLVIQVGVVGEYKSMCQMMNKDTGIRFVYRWMEDKSDLVHVNEETYRVHGCMNDHDQYELTVFQSSLLHDDEVFIVGRADVASPATHHVVGSHATAVMPVMFDVDDVAAFFDDDDVILSQCTSQMSEVKRDCEVRIVTVQNGV